MNTAVKVKVKAAARSKVNCLKFQSSNVFQGTMSLTFEGFEFADFSLERKRKSEREREREREFTYKIFARLTLSWNVLTCTDCRRHEYVRQ